MKAWRLAWRLAVAALVFAWIVREIDLGDVFAAMRGVPAAPLVAALLCTAVLQVVLAVRLRLLLGTYGLHFTFGDLLSLNLATTFYGLFIPGGGVASMALRFMRLGKAGDDYRHVLTATIYDRLAVFPTTALIGFLCWPFDGGGPRPLAAFGVLVAGALCGIALALPQVAEATLALVRARNGRTLSLGALPPRVMRDLLVLSVVAQLPGLVGFVVLARALGIAAPLAALGWIRSVVVLLAMLPVSIAGMGVREGTLLLLLRPLGVGDEAAVALGLLVFATTFLAAGAVGGLLELWRIFRVARE